MALIACESLYFHAACLGYLTIATANRDTHQCECRIHLQGMPPFELPAKYPFSSIEESHHDYVSETDGTLHHVHTITYIFDY